MTRLSVNPMTGKRVSQTRRNGTIVDYYYVDVPFELGGAQERGEIAIREAEDRARVWAMPCSWEAFVAGDSDTILVQRYRRM